MKGTISQFVIEALVLASPALFLLVLLLMATVKFPHNQFVVLLGIAQIFFLVLFGFFSQHDPTAMPSHIPLGSVAAADGQKKYNDFQDIHATLVVGFGFLVAFLRRYGFGSYTITLLLAAFTLELSLLVRGFLTDEFALYGKFYVNLQNLINADYTAAVVLISFGALCGKLSPMQYLLMALIGAPSSIFNEYIVVKWLNVQDLGGSICVHVFGAVFGLITGRVLFSKNWRQSDHLGSTYHTDIFTFIATGFLWVFWPSFNSANAYGVDARNRAIVNTYTALIGSTISAFIASSFWNKNEKFTVRHLTNASLAGGVALGACANILLAPFDALLVGVFSGIISVVGFVFLAPFLDKKLGFTDTRGVYSLHLLPGIVGIFASVLAFIFYSDNSFPDSARIVPTGRSQMQQALMQLAGLGITLAFAILVGGITGFVLKFKMLTHVREKELYCDADFFEVPEDYDFTSRITSHIDHVELTETTKLSTTEHTKLMSEKA